MDGLDGVAAARRANAAAAEAVSRLGPARSPRRDEIDALLALQPDPDAEILPDSPGVTHA